MGYHNSSEEQVGTITGSSDTDMPDVDYYREKLRALRAKCGLDGNSTEVRNDYIIVQIELWNH